MKRLWLSGALLLTAAGLAACGGGDSNTTATVTPPATSTTFADRFGSGFGTSFRVSANTDPRDVSAGDLDPVNPAATPLDLQ